MRFIRTGILAAALVAAALPALAQDMSAGEKMERDIWAKIKADDWTAVEAMIASGFQSVHEDGARDRDEELKLLKGLDLGEPDFTDFKVTEQGDAIIVTYKVSVTEKIGGKDVSSEPAVRQSVWLKGQAGWQWITHANLSPIGK